MKISIITVTLNNKSGLLRAIESVRSQTYKNVEHIIVDGGSTDGTVELMYNGEFRMYDLKFISEKDDGIYDAINKGIKLATGEVIGLLHSDDFYTDEFVLEKYAEAFMQSATRQASSDLQNQQPITNSHPPVYAVYSDLVYVGRKLEVGGGQVEENEKQSNDQSPIPYTLYPIPYTIIRYWKAHKTKEDFATKTQRHKKLKNGWMPPHPTLFVRKEVFEKYGLYRTDMKIAADYEMILRLFWKHKITAKYLPVTTYCMTVGGASNKSLKNIFNKSKEDFKSIRLHKLPFPLYTLMMKNLQKVPQFFIHH
ncbi:glycosyltransferase family 2 protein [Ignavibacterium album]|uniref:glycosyltransferase family 2 protein n=1 Tax=Ignavibacterium album TaxID=591197 RepID=UPI0026EFD3D1|nr:glycosyltransferase family 2 protein [Ignavibacterium album]